MTAARQPGSRAHHRGRPPARAPRLARVSSSTRTSYYRGMSPEFPAFALSEEHEALRESVRALADDKIAPRAAEVDQSGEFPWDVHDALAKAELTGVHIPEAYGGPGADA